MTLPILSVEVKEISISSNIDLYHAKIMDVLNGMNLDLKTDEDFLSAKDNVKLCGEIESKVADCKKALIAKCHDLNLIIGKLDEIDQASTKKRLTVNSTVKEREAKIKSDIVSSFKDKAKALVASISKTLPLEIEWPVYDPSERLKGVKTLQTYNQRCNDAYIEYLEALKSRVDILSLRYNRFSECTTGYSFLFDNVGKLIQNNDLEAIESICQARISQYLANEEAKSAKKLAEEAAMYKPVGEVINLPSKLPSVKFIAPVTMKEVVDEETGEVEMVAVQEKAPQVLNPPDRIYLHYGDVIVDIDHVFFEQEDIQWSESRISNSDVCYVRI